MSDIFLEHLDAFWAPNGASRAVGRYSVLIPRGRAYVRAAPGEAIDPARLRPTPPKHRRTGGHVSQGLTATPASAAIAHRFLADRSALGGSQPVCGIAGGHPLEKRNFRRRLPAAQRPLEARDTKPSVRG